MGLSEGQSVPASAAAGDLPWIGQEAVEDCGLAALAMIGHFHGRPVTVGQLRHVAQVGSAAPAWGSLPGWRANWAFSARAVEIHGPQFQFVRTPAVLHYRNGHYVVLYRYDVTGVTLGDPAAGIVRIAREEFHGQVSGAVLLVICEGRCSPPSAIISEPH